jgi:hypothetical protein
MPVSMFLLGRGRKLLGGLPTRLNCVNTKFQISTDLPLLGWKKISLHGPQTPSGPLRRPPGQKLSSSPIRVDPGPADTSDLFVPKCPKRLVVVHPNRR